MSRTVRFGRFIPPPAASDWPRITSESISDKEACSMANLMQLNKGKGLYNGSIYWTKQGSDRIITKSDIAEHWLSGEAF